MLSANNLTFVRHDRPLILNLNFELQAGEVLQVSGPNGCGKTTLLKLLCGLLTPNEGEIHWCGAPIYFLGHKSGIKDSLTVLENLRWSAAVVGIHHHIDYETILLNLNLLSKQNTLCAHLSAGQKQRVALAKLFFLNAKLWILDEPFTAIDQQGITFLSEIFSNHLANEGMIIFTSHQKVKIGEIDITFISL